ncbi:MAG: nitrile hydratase subunit alpha [Dehalococcoidia bacterium]
MSDQHAHDGHSHDDHGHEHGDGHEHPHEHPGMETQEELTWAARRFRAIEALLEEKGICTWDEVTESVQMAEARSPSDGARVVARAWVDPDFKKRLLEDPSKAVSELGYELPPNGARLEVYENTDDQHHMVVCTLCSCYPRSLLGRPPDWYKSISYRSRAVNDPRGVMKEFGYELPEQVGVEVHDSTADLRYIVLPKRPEGTEGWTEEQLAALATRDSMIGVTAARRPTASAV